MNFCLHYQFKKIKDICEKLHFLKQFLHGENIINCNFIIYGLISAKFCYIIEYLLGYTLNISEIRYLEPFECESENSGRG